MDTHKNLQGEQKLANDFYNTKPLSADKNDKRTLEEEADLTAEEIEKMEHDKIKEGTEVQKGSSGPEEKDLTVWPAPFQL